MEREQSEFAEPAGDRPAGLGLPPVIDHRPLQQRRRPLRGRRIATLAGEEQRLEFAQVIGGQQLALGVLLLDRAHRGRRGEQHFDPVLRDHPPERAGIRRADRLAFVHDAGAAAQQRRVDDVAVADHPADIGGRPDRRRRPRRRTACASSSTAPPRARRCRAPRPSAARSCRMCIECTADRSPPPARSHAARAAASASARSWSRPGVSAHGACSRCRIRHASGLCGDSAIAASSNGL